MKGMGGFNLPNKNAMIIMYKCKFEVKDETIYSSGSPLIIQGVTSMALSISKELLKCMGDNMFLH